MDKKRKILIFSVPFDGHLNVLKDLINNHGDSFDFQLIVTGWKNIPVDVSSLNIETHILAKSELRETDPSLWTFARVADDLEKCIEITKVYNPDLILYDFFSIEGYYVGNLLNIPYWCSIPALIGPFDTKEYLQNKLTNEVNQEAIKTISEKFAISIEQEKIEMISDGLHIPGQVNIVWSYESVSPSDYRKNRSHDPYVFVGSSKENYLTENNNKKPKIYLSFGTVVMNNLWNQQEDTKQRLIDFIYILTILWKDKEWEIVFASQGKQFPFLFPNNWEVLDHTDQIKTLSESDVFVTHGGGNSFHEAILEKIPMIAIPFFGDQLLVAQRIEELGIGISLNTSPNIDTHKSKNFLNKELALELEQSILKILSNQQYKKVFEELDLKHVNLKNLLQGRIEFSEGDLLFGTNLARKKYVEETGLQEEFKILEFKAFSELVSQNNALPRIVDIYHDVILNDDYFKKDISSNLNPYKEILQKYKEHLGESTDFCAMCIKGLDFFAELYKIHFILSDYDPEINYITDKEISHILSNPEKFKQSVIFYEKVATTWMALSHDDVKARFLKK